MKKITISDDELKESISNHVKKSHSDYRCLITIDRHYT